MTSSMENKTNKMNFRGSSQRIKVLKFSVSTVIDQIISPQETKLK